MHSGNRNRLSLYNAISAIGLTLVNGLLGIVTTRFVIAYFGSDFNGLNSTANQIVNMLLVLEGGFTLASNVALFSPIAHNDHEMVNSILSATRVKFRKIGWIFLLCGIAAAVCFAITINSGLPKSLVVFIVLMTVVPASFNLYYATTYRVLLQAQQKEYIINLISMFTIGIGHLANIVSIRHGSPMWSVRFITMICAIMNSLLIAGVVKRNNKFLDLDVDPRPDLIKGTGDVLAQKITGVIYNSAPIVFLAVSPVGGTSIASVYAVYNNVFVMIKSLLHGLIDAPRLSFGQMLTERKNEEIWSVFAQYEFVVFTAIFVTLTTACVLIMPFVFLYTNGVNDADYSDMFVALLMAVTTAVEMFHIPSGHLINMAGKFRISRNFQIGVCVILFFSMISCGNVFGIRGVLSAVLLAAVLLAVLETGYVHIFFFRGKLPELVRLALPLALAGVLICGIELSFPIEINGYVSFLFYGVILFLINAAAALIVGMVFDRKEMTALFIRCRKLFVNR